MPLFNNKFSPKKTPLRKSTTNLAENEIDELFSEQRGINLKLGDQELIFRNGEWIPASGENADTHKALQKCRRQLNDLKEENNLLRVKYEIILNMLSQTTAESHLQEREIEKLKRENRKLE